MVLAAEIGGDIYAPISYPFPPERRLAKRTNSISDYAFAAGADVLAHGLFAFRIVTEIFNAVFLVYIELRSAYIGHKLAFVSGLVYAGNAAAGLEEEAAAANITIGEIEGVGGFLEIISGAGTIAFSGHAVVIFCGGFANFLVDFLGRIECNNINAYLIGICSAEIHYAFGRTHKVAVGIEETAIFKSGFCITPCKAVCFLQDMKVLLVHIAKNADSSTLFLVLFTKL